MIQIAGKGTLQLVSTCSELVPNLFTVAQHTSVCSKRSFTLRTGEMKEKIDMDILKTRLGIKFRRITRPRFAIQKKLADRVLFGVEYHAKSGLITLLE